MDALLTTPRAERLGELLAALAGWQREDAALQLHPGDLGWFGRFGAGATAEALRTWTRDGHLLAVGLLDGADTLRMTVAPEASQDEQLAGQLAADLADPALGVLPAGRVSVETPNGSAVQTALDRTGWRAQESWTPLRHDLRAPAPAIGTGLRLETVDAARSADYAEVVRSAFGSTRFTAERWQAMADGPAYSGACSLIAYLDGVPAATITVWSAGPGRPGLIEPLGVHAEHRGRGLGRTICLAGLAALRDLRASSALVCTPSANTGGIATYESTGFERQPVRLDRTRG